MAAQAAWQWHSPHFGECHAATVTCLLRHSSNGRPICAAQKFPQEQVSSDVPPAHKMGDHPLSSSAHARTTQDPVRVCHASHICRRRARHPSLEHPPISSTLTVGDGSASLLNVVRMLGPGEPVRTERRKYRSISQTVTDYRDHWDRSEWVEWGLLGPGRAVTKVNNPVTIRCETCHEAYLTGFDREPEPAAQCLTYTPLTPRLRRYVTLTATEHDRPTQL